jgi:hypothetical protein
MPDVSRKGASCIDGIDTHTATALYSLPKSHPVPSTGRFVARAYRIGNKLLASHRPTGDAVSFPSWQTRFCSGQWSHIFDVAVMRATPCKAIRIDFVLDDA